MRFERYQAQFAFLRKNDITTPADMAAFEQRTEETLGRLTKQRTLLNVRKKKRQPLYAALADAEALEPSRALYEEGLTGMEQEFEQYMKAVKLLEDSGVPREVLKKEKAEVYEQLSEVNRKIWAEREKRKLCREICQQTLQWSRTFRKQKNTRRRCESMNIGGGEAADQLVRMMLSGSEVAVRLSGSAIKICWRSPWHWRKTTRPFPVKSIWSRC